MSKLESTVVINGRFPSKLPPKQLLGNDPAADSLQPGSKLGPYLIIAKLGDGGMGVVYKAQDTVLNRLVALKLMPPQLCQNPDYLKRFRNEAHTQAKLNSPYVASLYNLIELPVGQVLVMEYLEGQTLAQHLRSQGCLSIDEAVWVFQQALLGTEEIHRAGIVHRDLKPSNIFITHDHKVKIMDFGIAKFMDKTRGAHNALMGTLLYISPEQINGRQVDYRSDIYTLGISLYEAVAGQLPFRRKTDYALMHAHVQENPPRPRKHQRDIPRSIEQIILKAIQKEPHKRFQNIAEFHAALMTHGCSQRPALSSLLPGRLGKSDLSRNATLHAPLYTLYHYSQGLRPSRWLPLARNHFVIVALLAILTLGFSMFPHTNKTDSHKQQNHSNQVTDKYAPLRQAWGND